MVDERLPSDGNVRLRWYPANGFANPYWPTVAELNAGLRLEDAVPWENFDFGMQASDTSEAPPISAKSSVATRSTANYGGSLSVWYPGYYDDDANQLSLIYDALDEPRTIGYIVMSIDGEIGEAGQPADDFSFAAGDYVSVFRVQSDAWDDMTEGDDPFYYTINFLRNGMFAHYTVAAATSTPVVAVTLATTADVGDVAVASATVNTRTYSKGVNWSSSDADVATVSPAGVVTYLSAGSVTITATAPRSSASDSETVTVS